MTESPRITAISSGNRLDVLAPDTLEKLHQQTLELLDRVGVGLGPGPVLEALAQSDAEIDSAAGTVKFPTSMVERALERARPAIHLAGRDPANDLCLDGTSGYLAVDGCAAEIIDLDTGQKRSSCKADLAELTRIADALPEIAFTWQPVAARDVPVSVKPLHELEVQLANTDKHIQMMTCVTGPAAVGVVDIARAVGGDTLATRPIISAFQCSLSPLKYESGALEAAWIFAEAGIPCGFVVMPITCATAPGSRYGTLVVANAEVLAGIVILQTLVPAAPTFYGSCATAMDLFTGAAACGGPEDLLYQLATAQLARRYSIPSLVGTFATGSKSPDWQAGLENGLSGLASLIGGADMFCGAGLLFGASVFSAQQMVLDCEIFRLLQSMAPANALRAEDGIVDLIEAVGPGGHFLDREHTLAHMEDLWKPRFFDRQGWEDRREHKPPAPIEAARERARDLLRSHRTAPLPNGVAEEIRRIVSDHERRAEIEAHG